MSEDDRQRLMALRGMWQANDSDVRVEPEQPKRRAMTEAEERLLEAAMAGAETRSYYRGEESDYDKAQIAVLEERTSTEARKRFYAAYVAKCDAMLVLHNARKDVPECIRRKIVEEIDKRYEERNRQAK